MSQQKGTGTPLWARIAIAAITCAMCAYVVASVTSALTASTSDAISGMTTLMGQGGLPWSLFVPPASIPWGKPAVQVASIVGAAVPLVFMVQATIGRQKGIKEDTANAHGDARLARPSEIGDLLDKRHPFNNLRHTENSGLVFTASDKRTKDVLYGRNFNDVCLGISGLGKTFNCVMPDLMAATGDSLEPYAYGIRNLAYHIRLKREGAYALASIMPIASSGHVSKKASAAGVGEGFDFVNTDPKGENLRDCGQMLLDAGFDLRCMNTVDPREGCKVNPLAYVSERKCDVRPIEECSASAIAKVEGAGAVRFAVSLDGTNSLAMMDASLSIETSATYKVVSDSLAELPTTSLSAAELDAKLEDIDPDDPEFRIVAAQAALAHIEGDMGAFTTDAGDGERVRHEGSGLAKVAEVVRSVSYRRTSGEVVVRLASKLAHPVTVSLTVTLDEAMEAERTWSEPVGAAGAAKIMAMRDAGSDNVVRIDTTLPAARSDAPQVVASVVIPYHIKTATQADGVGLTKLVDTLVANLGSKTDAESNGSQDPFWEDTKRLCFMSLIAFLFEKYDPGYRTLPEMMRLLNMALAPSGDPADTSPLAVLIEEWEYARIYVSADDARDLSSMRSLAPQGRWEKADNVAHPRESSLAVHCYHAFTQCAPETVLSVIISCQAALTNLLADDVKEMLSADELGLDRLGDAGQKSAVFLVTSDTPSPYDFLTAMVVQLAIDLAQEKAYKRYGGKLPRHVRYILDEVANLGKIPILIRAIAVVRSRNMSISLYLQSKSQLALVYGEQEADVVFDNCSTLKFLGAQMPDTLEMISNKIGDETVYSRVMNRSFGAGGIAITQSQSESLMGTARKVISPAQLTRLSKGQMLSFVYNHHAILDDKIQTMRHPLYRYVSPTYARDWRQPPCAYAKRFDYTSYLRKRREAA